MAAGIFGESTSVCGTLYICPPKMFSSHLAKGTWGWQARAGALLGDVVYNITTGCFHEFLKGAHSFLSPGDLSELLCCFFFFVSPEGRPVW